MRIVVPAVDVVGYTSPTLDNIKHYIEEVAPTKFDSVYKELKSVFFDEDKGWSPELLFVIAGKVCYNSWEPGVNPNVSKVRDDYAEYIQNITKTGHGSVLEHVNLNFLVQNFSRVMTHELVRHRAGTAFSQESMRFVRMSDYKFWMPTCIKDNEEAVKLFHDTVSVLEESQRKLASIYDIDNIPNFNKKKELTSAFRRIAPDGLATNLVFSANIRAIRHIILIRSSVHAEEEIRIFASLLYRATASVCPIVMSDFYISQWKDGIPEYKCTNPAMPYDKGNEPTKDKTK